MKLPQEKIIKIKKSILKAIELGESPAKLGVKFGVSKSTIYKYRRELKELGFIKKNENDIYVVVGNKFSTKSKTNLETEPLDLSYNDDNKQEELSVDTRNNKIIDMKNTGLGETKNTASENTKESDLSDSKLQNKIDSIRAKAENPKEQVGIFKKLFSRLKGK